jgi:hypothetical protein
MLMLKCSIPFSDSLDKSQLKALCSDLGLKIGGNKGQLRERLKEYSENPSKWDRWAFLHVSSHFYSYLIHSTGPIAQRKHKGVRKVTDEKATEGSGTGKTKKKNYLAERIEQLRPDGDAHKPTERSKDTRTQKQKDDLIPWASGIIFILFYVPLNLNIDM